uniref:Uncharacterized protein n=1 Tax=Acrobeloides nanus TaxID=290746 RepID=A0A914E7Y9_9BILA
MVVIPDILEDIPSVELGVMMRDSRASPSQPSLIPPFVRIGKRRARPFMPIVEKEDVEQLVQPLSIVDLPLFLHLGPKPNKLPPGPTTKPKNDEDSAIRRFQKYLKMRHDYN